MRLLLLLCGVLALAACKPKKPAAFDLHIAFTCDVRGRLVPCGCFTGQMGGLTRVATAVEGLPGNALKVDVGDAIEGAEDFQRLKYSRVLQAFAQMGYEAANLGHREAQLGAVALREIAAKAPVPLLSANLMDKASGAPLLPGYRVVKRGAWKIALVGVMDSGISSEALGEGLAIESMETALSRLLPELKAKADFIVLLAFADEEALRRLARTYYELDVILGGKVSQPAQQLVRENESLILYTTNESRALGTLRVALTAPGKVTPTEGEVQLMHEFIPQSQAIRGLATEYREAVRGAKLGIDDPQAQHRDAVPGVRMAATFIGTEACVACHPSATKKWHDTGHARAFATLRNLRADADPDCIGCHVVGFGQASGYRREFAATKLVDVGCESCHGPGSLHVEQKRNGLTGADNFRALGAGDCQKCHHGEFSRPFDWDKFWPLVKHGKEGAAQ